MSQPLEPILPIPTLQHEPVDISIVIPVYKAAGCLRELHRRLTNTLEQLNFEFEIILIEDCGGDGSWEIIQELAMNDTRLRGFKLSRNFGQHNAITAGLDQVRGEWTVVMDCDLQDRPEDIGRLVEKAGDGHEIVIARSAQQHVSWPKRLTSNLFYKVLSWLSGYTYEPSVRPFRLLSKPVVNALRAMREQTRTLGPLTEWVGFSPVYLDLNTNMRYSGRSSYSWRKLLTLASKTIFAYSDKPLKISISMGIIISICAFIYGFYTVARALLYGVPVPGWTSLITSLYFIGGLIIANLGLFGIYIGKIFEETKNRPLYLIAQETRDGDAVVTRPARFLGKR